MQMGHRYKTALQLCSLACVATFFWSYGTRRNPQEATLQQAAFGVELGKGADDYTHLSREELIALLRRRDELARQVPASAASGEQVAALMELNNHLAKEKRELALEVARLRSSGSSAASTSLPYSTMPIRTGVLAAPLSKTGGESPTRGAPRPVNNEAASHAREAPSVQQMHSSVASTGDWSSPSKVSATAGQPSEEDFGISFANSAATYDPRSFRLSEEAALCAYLRDFLVWRAKSEHYIVQLYTAPDPIAPLRQYFDHVVDAALLEDFKSLVMPVDSRWRLAGQSQPERSQDHVIVLDYSGGGGGDWAKRLQVAWRSLPPGAIWAARVSAVDSGDFERGTFPLMYKVNCKSMESFANPCCNRGKPASFTCADLPYTGVFGVAFVQHFVIVEKDDPARNSILAEGELLAEVRRKQPESDKFEESRHNYQNVYERYLPPVRAAARESASQGGSRPGMLEIGLGCDMYYGPGSSADLWRRYFGERMQLSYVEIDADCVEKWKERMVELDIQVHVGKQEDDSTNEDILAGMPKNGFQVIIDDGGHQNKQIIKSLDVLFPAAVANGGLYFVEDMGDPAFVTWAYEDAELISSIFQIQRKPTALAHILRHYARGVVHAGARSRQVEFIDCRKNICVIKKKA